MKFRPGYPEPNRSASLFQAVIEANALVEGTAREAVDRGYGVVIVGDCCASMSQEVHDAALNNALPFLATITTSEEAIAALS